MASDNHERDYMYKIAADPNIKDFTAKDLAEIENKGVPWLCAVKCWVEYLICTKSGGSSNAECRQKRADCFTKCI